MNYLLKSDPSLVTADNNFVSSPVWIYQDCDPQLGDEIFVWTAHTAGGEGLQFRGTLTSIVRQRLRNGYPGGIVTVAILQKNGDFNDDKAGSEFLPGRGTIQVRSCAVLVGD